MSDTASAIVPHLPYLRRYARALTGSQARGDGYVRLCLETIVEEPNRVDERRPRLSLFKIFHDVFAVIADALPDPSLTSPAAGERSMRGGLAALPPVQRQVLLLTTLEEFSYEEAAEILGLSLEEIKQYLSMARDEIKLQASVPVLIIEDEAPIAMQLSLLVSEMGHTVCGTAAREDEAIQIVQQKKPALVLADIQLKDGDSGITAVQRILETYDVPVIFVTGFPERLLTGEKIEPAFIIPKPFDPDMLRAAIGQALSVIPPAAQV